MNEEFLDEAINELINGSAICLLGAGFSMGATDSVGQAIPSAKDLGNEICEIANLENEESASLSDLADYCEGDSKVFSDLTKLLMKRLTLCKPTDDQRTILEMPWRSVFTTNFDDIAEICLKKRGVIPVTPNFETSNLSSKSLPLYYLHGRARDILDGATDLKLILSERNYLELRQRNVDLYAALENDIYVARKIFFIGYSMRDAEIASRLFAVDGLKHRSIVITRPNDSAVAANRLRKFGEVFPISISGFAERLRKIPSESMKISNRKTTSFVSKIPLSGVKSEITSEDFDRLLLTGEFDYSAFAYQQNNSNKSSEYCVTREVNIKRVFDAAAKSLNRFVVSSDLGNGKTTFLAQLTSAAHTHGYEVYKITKQLPEMYPELDQLLSTTKKRMFIIEDHVRYSNVVKYIGKRLPGTSVLVTTVRSGVDEAAYSQLQDDLGGVFREIDLNTLTDDELHVWNDILERWGLWEDKIQLTDKERFSFLKDRCGAENRAIIVSLFKTSKLSEKIDNLVNFFLVTNGNMTKPFIAVIINALCQDHVDWARIVNWLRINEDEFKHAVMNSPIADIMKNKRTWYQFTSPELASFILNKFDFEFSDIVDVYTEIVRQTAYCANDPRSGFDATQNLKELMKFRFLTRLFSDRDGASDTILAVYQRLSNVPRIRGNDQFYLQYAMANMEIGDLDKAEGFIETAIGLANKKGVGYSKRQILDQRVRLRFQKNTITASNSFSKNEISESISDLTNALMERNEYVVHPLRSAFHVYNFLDRWCEDLDPDTLDKIQALVNLMSSKIGDGNLAKSQRGETQKIRKAIFDCSLVLQNL